MTAEVIVIDDWLAERHPLRPTSPELSHEARRALEDVEKLLLAKQQGRTA